MAYFIDTKFLCCSLQCICVKDKLEESRGNKKWKKMVEEKETYLNGAILVTVMCLPLEAESPLMMCFPNETLQGGLE